jgi:zinc/manganese transport system permease protein
MPALGGRIVKDDRLMRAYITGAVAYAAGLSLSAIYDLPSGAAIVWTLALTAIASTAFKVRRP